MFPETVQLLKKPKTKIPEQAYNLGAAQLLLLHHYCNRRLASFWREHPFFLQNPEMQKMQLKEVILDLELRIASFEIIHFFWFRIARVVVSM